MFYKLGGAIAMRWTWIIFNVLTAVWSTELDTENRTHVPEWIEFYLIIITITPTRVKQHSNNQSVDSSHGFSSAERWNWIIWIIRINSCSVLCINFQADVLVLTTLTSLVYLLIYSPLSLTQVRTILKRSRSPLHPQHYVW